MSIAMAKRQHPMRNTYTPARRPSSVGTGARRPSAVGGGAKSAAHAGLDTEALRSALLWAGGIVFVLLFFAGLGFGLMQAYRHCTTSAFFAISEVRVEGAELLRIEDVIAQSGLHEGENSLLAHIPDVEQRLLANPWVESVSIRRELPGTFTISIKERTPHFWVLRDNALHYLDADGRLIAPVESGNFRSLPTLDIGPGGEEAVSQLAVFMAAMRDTKLPFDPSQISWLRVSAGKGFELYWENRQLSLSVGIENWRENLARLGPVILDIEKRNEISNTREIRSADGQVWLRKA